MFLAASYHLESVAPFQTTSTVNEARPLTMLGADHMKVKCDWLAMTMSVSAAKMMPDTGVGFVGRWSAGGAGSPRRSQWRMLEPGK